MIYFFSSSVNEHFVSSYSSKKCIELDVFHDRLDQSSFSKLQHIDQCKSYDVDKFFCATRCVAKNCIMYVLHSASHVPIPFEIIYVDLWSEYVVSSLNSALYFHAIVDDYTRSTWACLLHNKTQVAPTPRQPKGSAEGVHP